MNERQRAIAVDFDGVIADYSGWKGSGIFGPPRRDVLDVLKVLASEGWKIIVHTTRGPEEVVQYLVENRVPFHEINRNSSYQNMGAKPVATVYWDDRGCRYSGDAYSDLETIRNFFTWSGRR